MIGRTLSFYLHDCYLYKCPRGKLESRDIIITLRELIFAVFADLGSNRKIKFPQNVSNAKHKGRIIHRTALISFKWEIRKIKFPQKIP